MRLAIIDLGSNTFHLLIVDVIEDKFQEIFRKRVFVGLGDGGIDILKNESIERGLATCEDFKKLLEENKCDKVRIIGTAALRSAKNSAEFITKAEDIFKHKLSIIDGGKEANLIYKGVSLLSPMIETTLIMDIGGGSTEFIIVENGQFIWAQSYKLGVGVLHSLFHKTEPIAESEILSCKQHIIQQIQSLIEKLKDYKIETLIGASGSFEVFESMSGLPTHKHETNIIEMKKAKEIIQSLVKLNYEERTRVEGLPIERVKLIVVGFILIEVILDLVNPAKLYVTPYALKEGVLSEMI